MCGIIGCAARRDVADLILGGLRQLEYRGYDSAGLAVIRDGALLVVRREGRIDNLAGQVKVSGVDGHTGIGHTRWATHGAPSEKNAHPHADGSGNLAVVHNGIIENFREVLHTAEGEGPRVPLETDSEVFAHLVQEHLKATLLDAVRTFRSANYAGPTRSASSPHDHPRLLVGARRDSPLVVGRGKGEKFLASDASAVLEYTSDVVYLDDGEIAELRPDGVRIVDLHGKNVRRDSRRVEWVARPSGPRAAFSTSC
ncbi:MAG: hypothetical protein IPH13_13255 [Planctomycetes bacterium]|nr:hypothetical protein [Planctomycetota bacterium]